ncbi:hypothetical protein Salat_1755000 [Sesamum alatum]|uniref:Uncharacterized protein n=1 Tax=Sesamum alatum TaxID=300844 RepID=A0AAE1Y8T1_9LAMI|nr:hypothetical protein Salat_1755000 [Sesamum alatum]
MAEDSTKEIALEIKHMLDCLRSPALKPSIFKVDDHLRIAGRDNDYEPEVLSIGPYHHGKSSLQNMDLHKCWYLKQLLSRKNDSVEKYVTAVAAMEERARRCYAEPVDLDGNEFIKMMVLDGCFLIELLRYHSLKDLRTADDPIFKNERILSQLRHDITLLENQLPFFVLNQLFNMTKIEDSRDDIIGLTLCFIDGMFLNISVSKVYQKLPTQNIDHLCSLIHEICCLPFAGTILHKNVGSNACQNWESIQSTSGLQEVGIRFQKTEGTSGFMDITFENGVLRIPPLNIFDETESQFRNLIAYEQYLPDCEARYVSDYTFFMHCLIRTPEDVRWLCYYGIIGNWLGDDKEICEMFNRLGKNILTSTKFSYAQIFSAVNCECQRRSNSWITNLRRNYFGSPWSIISVLAAVALLILTLLQTLYTMLSYYNHIGKAQQFS